VSENSGPGGKSNSKKMQDIRETQRETARIAQPKTTPKGGPGAKIQTTGSLSTAKAVKKYVTDPGPNFKGVGSNFYKAPDPIITPKNTKPKGGSDSGVKDEQQVTVISAPVQTGLVDNLNIKEEYRAEARRIILSLVKSAKDLLIKYNFSSIDRVAEYALDSDKEAKTEYVVSQTSRPESPFTLDEAAMQDRFSQDIIAISNSISDMVEDSVKLNWFGTVQCNRFLPGKPRISNGVSSYDMKLTVNVISNKTFVIKCYEIS
jgi:hypothetical protein